MLDDFREQANASPFFDDDDAHTSAPPPRDRFLGMTPLQRFVIAMMLLLMACLLSTFCLLIAGKIVPGFM
jgi:hypothetical protein